MNSRALVGRWLGSVATVGLALLFAFSPFPTAESVERWFSLAWYPRLQHVLTPMSNTVPFALLDLLALVALIAVVVAITRAVRAARREHGLAPIGRVVARLVTAAAGLYLVFLALWGLNYRRMPMQDRLVLDRTAPASADVVRLGLDAIAELNALHGPAHAQGWGRDESNDAALTRAFAASQRLLSDAPPAVPGRLKRTLFGPYFRWTGVDGMVNPFGLEVLANPDLLPFERPFVAAHEWSHLAGFADEAEANFVGWLTCIRASRAAQYSGWLYLYWQISGEVSAADRAALWEAVAPGPRADVEAIIARVQRGQLPPLRSASWLVYDQYLKANRVESGVRSYGAVVTLILRARFDPGWVPVRRAS
ncbi:MAG: DUF3810 family protein [Vicinamibacterales bacterium]